MYFGSFISERKRKHQQMMQIFLDTNNQQVYNITFMREKERKKCAKTIFKSNVVIFCSILHFRELITVHWASHSVHEPNTNSGERKI